MCLPYCDAIQPYEVLTEYPHTHQTYTRILRQMRGVSVVPTKVEAAA